VEKVERRKTIRMTPAEAWELLETTPNLALATIGRDGYPHVVAMSFGVDNGDIVMTSYAKAQKVLNLQRDARATVMAERGLAYNQLKGVMIRGHCELSEGADAVIGVMRILGKKMAKIAGRTAPSAGDDVLNNAAARSRAAKRVVIRFKPERWASWDHSKLPAGTY
jgi:nitroimidazol reductase NimA-like FMN-containing flavoprotein (pyridoxamine 5'-phosphate oxidase superfamily)